MVYNEKMDLKLSGLMSNWKNLSKKKMFGGTGYLLNGNMVAGIYKDYYILRLGEVNANNALKNPKIKLMDITGRLMKAWVMIEEDAFTNDNELKEWLNRAKMYVDTLPAK